MAMLLNQIQTSEVSDQMVSDAPSSGEACPLNSSFTGISKTLSGISPV